MVGCGYAAIMDDGNGEVTIVVASHNRQERLDESVPHHRAPVIVVDNGSAVPLDVPGAKVVRLEQNIGAAARNVGVDVARTPYVAFADDDSWWASGALERAAGLFTAHRKAALLVAKVLVGAEERVDPISREMAAAPLGAPPGAAGPSVLGFLACSVVVRRDAFLAAGGFQKRLFVYGEEALLAMDLAAAGHELSYAPDLVVHHYPAPDGRHRRGRAHREGRNRVLTALLRRPPSVVASALLRNPSAALSALPDLSWALSERRLLPSTVEQALQTLEHPAPPPH
jgi:N-acetylglucosaminyl-diphospho-decaprenol L-rhamnosyltransferase